MSSKKVTPLRADKEDGECSEPDVPTPLGRMHAEKFRDVKDSLERSKKPVKRRRRVSDSSDDSEQDSVQNSFM